MASIDRPSSRVTIERLRAGLARLWRPIAAQRRAVRWGLATAVLVTLGAVSYWGAGNLSPSGVRYLNSGKRFSSEELITVVRTLEKQRVAYRIDDQRRVEVAPGQFELAAESVAKLDLGPLSINDIRDRSSASIFDGTIEREYQERVRLEQMLERLIGEQEGVLSSFVSINRPRAQRFSRPSDKPSALVYVETEKGRAVPSRSVQAILSLLGGMVPGLETGSITLMDHRGMRYLDPGNPALRDRSRNRAREEEITEEILEKLDWIKGVRVQVQVISPHAGELATATPSGSGSSTTAKGAGAGEGRREPSSSQAGAIEEQSSGSHPLIGVNRPLSLEGGGEMSPRTPAAAQPAAGKSRGGSRPAGEGWALAEPAAAARSAARGADDSSTSKERGRVVVNVPRSFYLNMEIRGDQGKPSLEELRVMADRTEKSILTTISLLLPDSDSWKVEVGTFADEVALSRPTVVPETTDTRQRLMEWGIVGAVGVGVSVLAIAGSLFRLARRPSRLPVESDRSRRYHAGSVLQASPSERVRELIQRNPEAAASVLQRWVGQGGRSS